MTGIASATFRKRERIVSRKLIEQLFIKDNSHSTTAFPIRTVYMENDSEEGKEPVQVLISVSKRHFKRAVKRNRVKRQIREAYRRNKQVLTDKMQEGKSMSIAFIWLADRLYESQQVERCVRQLLEKIADRV